MLFFIQEERGLNISCPLCYTNFYYNKKFAKESKALKEKIQKDKEMPKC